MKLSFKNIVLGFSLLVLAAGPVQAGNDLVVNCPNEGPECLFANSGSATSGLPLLQETNMAPGQTASQVITVNNNDADDACDLTMTIDPEALAEGAVNLAQVTDLCIYSSLDTLFGTTDGTVATYTEASSQTLQTLYDTGSLAMGSIEPGANQSYTWLVTLDGERVGNDYQGASTRFDFAISFACGTPTPTPVPSDGSEVAGVSDGGGSTSTPDAPHCEFPDMFPNAPGGLSAVSGTNSVNLAWSAVDGAAEYVIFFYDAAGTGYSVLSKYVGSSTNYSISNLAPGNWTFQVAAVGGNQDNGNYLCSSPRAGTSVTIGGAPVTGLPVGEEEGAVQVLGVEDEAEPVEEPKTAEITPAPDVMGATSTCQTWQLYIPWILLLAQLGFIVVVDLKTRKEKTMTKQLAALGITAASIIIFYLVRECQCYSGGSILAWLCQWYWLVSLLLTVLTRLVNYGFIEVVETQEPELA